MTSETFTRSFGWFWDPAHKVDMTWKILMAPKTRPGAGWQQGWRLQSCRHQGAWENLAKLWLGRGQGTTSGFMLDEKTTCLVHDLGALSQGAINNRPATCLTFFSDTAPLSWVSPCSKWTSISFPKLVATVHQALRIECRQHFRRNHYLSISHYTKEP